jgi:hypothetical protein
MDICEAKRCGCPPCIESTDPISVAPIKRTLQCLETLTLRTDAACEERGVCEPT